MLIFTSLSGIFHEVVVEDNSGSKWEPWSSLLPYSLTVSNLNQIQQADQAPHGLTDTFRTLIYVSSEQTTGD